MHLVYGSHHNEGLTPCTLGRQLKQENKSKKEKSHLLRMTIGIPIIAPAHQHVQWKKKKNWQKLSCHSTRFASHRSIDELESLIMTPKWPAIDQCRGDMMLLGRRCSRDFCSAFRFCKREMHVTFCFALFALASGKVQSRAEPNPFGSRVFEWRTECLKWSLKLLV